MTPNIKCEKVDIPRKNRKKGKNYMKKLQKCKKASKSIFPYSKKNRFKKLAKISIYKEKKTS